MESVLLVGAPQLLSSPAITTDDLCYAREGIMSFLKQFNDLYGRLSMHVDLFCIVLCKFHYKRLCRQGTGKNEYSPSSTMC